MKKYVALSTFLSLLSAQTSLVCAQRTIHTASFPALVTTVPASCGYKAVSDGMVALRQVLGLPPSTSTGAEWVALVGAQTDATYAGTSNLESEPIRLLIEQFIPEIGNHFVVMDNAQNFLGNKFVKFNTVRLRGADVDRFTHIDQVPAEMIRRAQEDGRERFWAAVRGIAAQPGPQNFLFIVNTSAVVPGTIGGEHWYMVLFHKDRAGVHHYYVSENYPPVQGIIDQIENRAGRVANAAEIAWAFEGAEEAAQVARNEQIRHGQLEEDDSEMARALAESAAIVQRPVAAAAVVDDELEAVLRFSAQEARQQEERALQCVLRESEHLERVRRQQREQEQQEALELARVLEESRLLAEQQKEQTELQRVLEMSRQQEGLRQRLLREKEWRVAEEREVLQRAAQAREDAQLARTLQQQGGAAARPQTAAERMVEEQRRMLEEFERKKRR